MNDDMVEKRSWAILQVRSGRMTVQQAAETLGVSRKTYYEWEKKALSAMAASLEDGDAGRPENGGDPEKEALKKEVARLNQELTVARESLHVRRVLDAYAEKLQRDEAKKLKKKSELRAEAAEEVMKHMDAAKFATGLTYRRLCAEMEVPFVNFRRWQKRRLAEEPLLRVPGPKKTEPFDLALLRNEITHLPHGTHRTQGTGRLHEKYRLQMSRRDLDDLVASVRRDLNREERKGLLRVEWLVPGVVWSIDGTEYTDRGVPAGAELMTVKDMASKYLFRPMATAWTPCEEEVSGHLSRLFFIHGAPLFVKKDNGGNLRGGDVASALQKSWVFPLTSPPEYPRYNGSLEHSQGDIKEAIQQSLPLGGNVTLEEFEMVSRIAAHDLNHEPSKVLKGRTPCSAFNGGKNPAKYDIDERRAVYDFLNETAECILQEIKDDSKMAIATAKRKAAEMWLVKNNMIRLTVNGKSVTLF